MSITAQIAGIIALGTLVSGAFFVDDRYLNENDFLTYAGSMEQVIIRIDLQTWRDRLYTLKAKTGCKTPVAARRCRELKDIIRDLERRQRK